MLPNLWRSKGLQESLSILHLEANYDNLVSRVPPESQTREMTATKPQFSLYCRTVGFPPGEQRGKNRAEVEREIPLASAERHTMGDNGVF